MRMNWKRFAAVFGLLQLCFLLVGCSAAWLGAVSALLPALEAAVSAAVAFVAALEGKTVPLTVTTTIKKIGDDIAAEIVQVQQLIVAYKAAASTGTLSQIEAVMQAILNNLSGILSAGGIVDSSTVSKLTALIGLAVAAAQSIFALIPLVGTALTSGASNKVLEAQDKEAAVHIESAHSALKQAYVKIITTATESADVNIALSGLPTSLP